MAIRAVIFDLDGVLIASESVWADVRRDFVLSHGGQWPGDVDTRMMGMSTVQWAEFLHRELSVAMAPDDIASEVVHAMSERYTRELPVLPAAAEAVRRVAARWPLAVASSSPPGLIRVVLEAMDVRDLFQVVMSTETVGRGKPAPDVYLAVARRLGTAPTGCAAVEDSTNGLRAARAAGMRVIAVPNRDYPPDPDDLARADAVIESLDDLTEAVVDPALR
jgi:HAD superfamily hydrolase (TIGR01509 family)